jgi:anti-anti-sigma factor
MLKVQTTNFGNVAVLCVQGRIVRGETEALRNAFLSQLNASAVVLDLARVSTIDAGGLGLMLELREYAESRGIEFRLRSVSRLVKRILEITRLDAVFKVATEKEVVKAPLARPPIALRTAACV